MVDSATTTLIPNSVNINSGRAIQATLFNGDTVVPSAIPDWGRFHFSHPPIFPCYFQCHSSHPKNDVKPDDPAINASQCRPSSRLPHF
jgi:hypothetical protein